MRMSVALGYMAATVVMSCPQEASARAGTRQVARTGQPVRPEAHWPQGVEALLSDPARGDGWHGYFSEWPNDVKHYEFKVRDSDQLNALIALFARIESDHLQIRLSPLTEPAGLGWVTSLPAGNGTAVLFSIGDQSVIDQWYGRLPGGKFGVMTFEQAPVAVPPTLTIFVGNKAVDLLTLRIRDQIGVSFGYVPTIFWEWNRTPRLDENESRDLRAGTPAPPEVQRAAERIQEFLDQRKQAGGGDTKAD